MTRSAMRITTIRHSNADLIAAQALRDKPTGVRAAGCWSQAAKDRIYARMFPEQTGPLDDLPHARA